jgi:hypothetical protein
LIAQGILTLAVMALGLCGLIGVVSVGILGSIAPDAHGLSRSLGPINITVNTHELLGGARDAQYAEQWAMADAQRFAPVPAIRSAA